MNSNITSVFSSIFPIAAASDLVGSNQNVVIGSTCEPTVSFASIIQKKTDNPSSAPINSSPTNQNLKNTEQNIPDDLQAGKVINSKERIDVEPSRLIRNRNSSTWKIDITNITKSADTINPDQEIKRNNLVNTTIDSTQNITKFPNVSVQSPLFSLQPRKLTASGSVGDVLGSDCISKDPVLNKKRYEVSSTPNAALSTPNAASSTQTVESSTPNTESSTLNAVSVMVKPGSNALEPGSCVVEQGSSEEKQGSSEEKLGSGGVKLESGRVKPGSDAVKQGSNGMKLGSGEMKQVSDAVKPEPGAVISVINTTPSAPKLALSTSNADSQQIETKYVVRATDSMTPELCDTIANEESSVLPRSEIKLASLMDVKQTIKTVQANDSNSNIVNNRTDKLESVVTNEEEINVSAEVPDIGENIKYDAELQSNYTHYYKYSNIIHDTKNSYETNSSSTIKLSGWDKNSIIDIDINISAGLVSFTSIPLKSDLSGIDENDSNVHVNINEDLYRTSTSGIPIQVNKPENSNNIKNANNIENEQNETSVETLLHQSSLLPPAKNIKREKYSPSVARELTTMVCDMDKSEVVQNVNDYYCDEGSHLFEDGNVHQSVDNKKENVLNPKHTVILSKSNDSDTPETKIDASVLVQIQQVMPSAIVNILSSSTEILNNKSKDESLNSLISISSEYSLDTNILPDSGITDKKILNKNVIQEKNIIHDAVLIENSIDKNYNALTGIENKAHVLRDLGREPDVAAYGRFDADRPLREAIEAKASPIKSNNAEEFDKMSVGDVIDNIDSFDEINSNNSESGKYDEINKIIQPSGDKVVYNTIGPAEFIVNKSIGSSIKPGNIKIYASPRGISTPELVLNMSSNDTAQTTHAQLTQSSVITNNISIIDPGQEQHTIDEANIAVLSHHHKSNDDSVGLIKVSPPNDLNGRAVNEALIDNVNSSSMTQRSKSDGKYSQESLNVNYDNISKIFGTFDSIRYNNDRSLGIISFNYTNSNNIIDDKVHDGRKMDIIMDVPGMNPDVGIRSDSSVQNGMIVNDVKNGPNESGGNLRIQNTTEYNQEPINTPNVIIATLDKSDSARETAVSLDVNVNTDSISKENIKFVETHDSPEHKEAKNNNISDQVEINISTSDERSISDINNNENGNAQSIIPIKYNGESYRYDTKNNSFADPQGYQIRGDIQDRVDNNNMDYVNIEKSIDTTYNEGNINSGIDIDNRLNLAPELVKVKSKNPNDSVSTSIHNIKPHNGRDFDEKSIVNISSANNYIKHESEGEVNIIKKIYRNKNDNNLNEASLLRNSTSLVAESHNHIDPVNEIIPESRNRIVMENPIVTIRQTSTTVNIIKNKFATNNNDTAYDRSDLNNNDEITNQSLNENPDNISEENKLIEPQTTVGAYNNKSTDINKTAVSIPVRDLRVLEPTNGSDSRRDQSNVKTVRESIAPDLKDVQNGKNEDTLPYVYKSDSQNHVTKRELVNPKLNEPHSPSVADNVKAAQLSKVDNADEYQEQNIESSRRMMIARDVPIAIQRGGIKNGESGLRINAEGPQFSVKSENLEDSSACSHQAVGTDEENISGITNADEIIAVKKLPETSHNLTEHSLPRIDSVNVSSPKNEVSSQSTNSPVHKAAHLVYESLRVSLLNIKSDNAESMHLNIRLSSSDVVSVILRSRVDGYHVEITSNNGTLNNALAEEWNTWSVSMQDSGIKLTEPSFRVADMHGSNSGSLHKRDDSPSQGQYRQDEHSQQKSNTESGTGGRHQRSYQDGINQRGHMLNHNPRKVPTLVSIETPKVRIQQRSLNTVA